MDDEIEESIGASNFLEDHFSDIFEISEKQINEYGVVRRGKR